MGAQQNKVEKLMGNIRDAVKTLEDRDEEIKQLKKLLLEKEGHDEELKGLKRELAEKEKEVRVLTDSVKDRVPADKMRDLMALPAATVRVAVRKISELTIDVPHWARADAELVAEIEKSSVADQWTRIMKDAETEGNFVWCPLVVVAELPLAEQAKAQKLVPWL